MAELQWLTDAEADRRSGTRTCVRVSDELADVLLYLLRFADVCGIDPAAAAHAKIDRNELRFPAPASEG